jgi:chemosensory pili system protein ChpA (sensor histidine kinase/response regulator)
MMTSSSAISGGVHSANVVRDEVDNDLLPLLLEEAKVIYPKICFALNAWRNQAGADIHQANQLQRCLHTFKGSSRMAGAMRMGELVHQIEGHITAAISQAVIDVTVWDELDRYVQRLAAAIEGLERGQGSSSTLDEAPPRQSKNGQIQLFSSIGERLYRVARQTSKELGRRINLEIIGGDVGLDSAVLESLTAPLEHLLRNAIAHGIEAPEQRELLGKPGIGEICLSLSREKNGIVIEFSDDGAGLDMAKLRRQAVDRNLIPRDWKLSDQQATQLIFLPGLSTAPEVTEICGRGIGLDVVRSEVTALGGSLDVASMQGQGLVFTICLPDTKPFSV